MGHYEKTSLWKNAFDPKNDGLDEPRARLKTAYQDFRSRVEILLQQIHKELPSLTRHDITHVDSLWRIASEIAGPDFDLNPAEAFVLGGAFLLHDAAHCRAAFSGGLKELQETTEWKDSIAHHNYSPDEVIEGTEPFQVVLFETLRLLHPKQAKTLPFAKWQAGDDSSAMYLFPHEDLREAYGHIIGEVAESHWWYPHSLENIANKKATVPPCLAPANWIVDVLKIAVLLRTADAAHIDANRAPRFLMLMTQPQGISKKHWQFQARLNLPTCVVERNELIISGSPFPEDELSAWWLAYDAACLANKELLAADLLLRDSHRTQRLAARSIADTHSPESFSKHVPTSGWTPVNTNIKISNVKTLVERFGGAKLYGNVPSAALRELLQNAVDAVHACRSLGGLASNEGEIEVALEKTSDGCWMHIADTGIGMSRYVLTEVLLDFGHSFWRSADLQGEWSGLASSGFEAIGQFGIGFFSIFMLGEQVRVITKRYEPKGNEAGQWLLTFADGVNKRPTLREPVGQEKLKRHGTRISVLLSEGVLNKLCEKQKGLFGRGESTSISFDQVCARLAPALDINLYVKNGADRKLVVKANDWLSLPAMDLFRRIAPGYLDSTPAGQAGFWSNISDVTNDSGATIGRCTIRPYSHYDLKYGVGVVNGLFAGTVAGIAGIILSKPQMDLARKEAIPDVVMTKLQEWAEVQKQIYLKNNKLTAAHSALLAHFGADHSCLRMGDFNRQEISLEDFVEAIRELDEVIIHSGSISFNEIEDENITPKDFEADFEVLENVLELPGSAGLSGWLCYVDDGSLPSDTWSLESAIQAAFAAAWGEGVGWGEETTTVGYVNGEEITRRCKVMTRLDLE